MPAKVLAESPGETERLQVERAVLDVIGRLVDELVGPRHTPVAPDDSLDRDLGLGSLERVELLLRLELSLGVRVPDTVIETADTPRDLIRAVIAARPTAADVPSEVRRPLAPATAAPPGSRTLVDVVSWHAAAHAERAHVFLRTDDRGEEVITYGALLAEASGLASALREHGLRRGESVALMLRTERAFFSAFVGTLLAGGVPIPIYPPFRPDRLEEYVDRQTAIIRNAEAAFVLTFRDAHRLAGLLGRRAPSVRRVLLAEGRTPRRDDRSTAWLAPDDVALIQYTSGSTGAPKGVVLSHANILANVRAIGQAIAIGPEDVGVTWLPLYHDMGLIGSWLCALYFGIPLVVLPPLAFLSRPSRWLRALHEHRGTLSAAPNFAFDLCVHRVRDEEIVGLDLSAWRLAMNGSEAVTPATVGRFTERFARYGFRAQAMCPVYGLAESSVALTVTPPGRGPRIDRIERDPFERHGEARATGAETADALSFVSCGRPLDEHQVRIVDSNGGTLGARRQGRILFRGPSVTRGYFRNPEATRSAFHDGWMDSGDLGYQTEGELVVTGRKKDVIIKAGRNLYPEEVEEVVARLPGIRKGRVAAFAVPAPEIGTERLVVVAETRERVPEARERLRRDIVDATVAVLGVPPDAVVAAGPGAVLKTPSGKLRRGATRDAYLQGRLGQRPPSPRMAWLRLTGRDVVARARRLVGGVRAEGFTARLVAVLLVAVPALAVSVRLVSGPRVNLLVHRWARTVLRLCGIPVRSQGVEHLGGRAPVVLVANHASYADALVLLAALPPTFRFVAKRELESTPVVRTVIERGGHLTVDRAGLSRSVTGATRAVLALREGTTLLFFPEGTFGPAPGLLPFRLGAFAAAVQTGTPVVPVTLRGTRDVLSADRWLARRAPVSVTVSPAIRVAANGWPEIVRVRDAARAEIAGRLGE